MTVYIMSGKEKDFARLLDSICDPVRTAGTFEEDGFTREKEREVEPAMTYEEFCACLHADVTRYCSDSSDGNQLGSYVSGYLCDPLLAKEQFAYTKGINLERIGKTLKDEKGNYYYHIIQSFPKGFEISDEEVHQCGVEMVQQLGSYQAVIATHVRPWVDGNGDLHGLQKRNHIIMNSHIFHEFVDEARPRKMKYRSGWETYSDLQEINDEIAIKHGVPVFGME